MGNVILSGYFGFNNAGDEAILASMIETLKTEIPGINMIVLSNNPEQTQKQYHVQAVNRWRLDLIIPYLRTCDLFISGGGSLLQDVTGPKSILYYLGLNWLAQVFRRRVMLYAQGIGPVKRNWARKLLARIINGVDLVSVRDQASKDDLISMGVSKPSIYVTADPVLGWKREMGETAVEILCRAKVDESRCIGVCLREWEGLNKAELAQVCDFIVKKGYRVVFFPFHFPADIAPCREVAKQMDQKSYLIKENLTPGEMMDTIGKMHAVIGMRLHALIMAAAQGVPFVPISYDPKIERFAAQMGQETPCSVENLRSKNLMRFLEHFLEEHSLIKQELIERVEILSVKARENAIMAAKLINKR
jgi:polysaccharide pyruvyl transferase CsaB